MVDKQIPERRVFTDSRESLVELFELHPRGVVFTCPECGEDLIVVLSKEEARRTQLHPGIYCPTNSSHVWQMFNLSGDG